MANLEIILNQNEMHAHKYLVFDKIKPEYKIIFKLKAGMNNCILNNPVAICFNNFLRDNLEFQQTDCIFLLLC